MAGQPFCYFTTAVLVHTQQLAWQGHQSWTGLQGIDWRMIGVGDWCWVLVAHVTG